MFGLMRETTHIKELNAQRAFYQGLLKAHESENDLLRDDLVRARAERNELYRDAMKHRASIAPLAAANAKKSAEAKAKREKVG